jgi:predicted DNA binding protein
MWVARLKILRASGVIARATGSFNAVGASYYMNNFKRGGRGFVTKVMYLGGPEKEKLYEAMLGHRKIRVLSREGDQVIYEHKATDTFHARVLDGSVFIVGPIVAKEGLEYWTIASWTKKNILLVVRRLSAIKGVKVSLEGLNQEEIDFFLPATFARLSKKERQALLSAVQEGYYDFPRKKNLERMAQEKGVNESTLREELRKAEGKVLRAAVRQATAI